MSKVVFDLTTEPGYLTVSDGVGNKSKYAIAAMLRAADIPTGLTYTQVAAITTLANLVVILTRTLIERGVLDESFTDENGMDWDLEHIIHAIEQMGGTFHDPDLDDV